MPPKCETCGKYWDIDGHECKGMKVNIEFTVTPTDDPDMVVVTQPGGLDLVRERGEVTDLDLDYLGAVSLAARRYFDAHPPKPEPGPVADSWLTSQIEGFRPRRTAAWLDGYARAIRDVNRDWPVDAPITVEPPTPKPAHPLADAKVGELWEMNYANGRVNYKRVTEYNRMDPNITSARPVYVIPKDEADRKLASFSIHTEAESILDGAL